MDTLRGLRNATPDSAAGPCARDCGRRSGDRRAGGGIVAALNLEPIVAYDGKAAWSGCANPIRRCSPFSTG